MRYSCSFGFSLRTVSISEADRNFGTVAQLGKKNYARADRLLQEIATEIEPGQIIKTGEKNGLKLKDKFFEKDIVWTPCAARRWELEEVET